MGLKNPELRNVNSKLIEKKSELQDMTSELRIQRCKVTFTSLIIIASYTFEKKIIYIYIYIFFLPFPFIYSMVETSFHKVLANKE